ncbi:MAG TPA: hypothetical protein VJ724_11700 [Tahibacter sp.]|nr:hypothetical protein [Tahibacter sp.]
MRYAAVTLLVAAVAAALVVHRYAQPDKVAAALAGYARDRLGLDLTFAGEPRYAFWPTLRLELDRAELHRLGATAPMLAVAQAGVVLPWTSLTDSTLAIETLRLADPVLDLDEANAWLAASPSGPAPDIRAGLVVTGGTIRRNGKAFVTGFALDGELDLPALAAWWNALASHADVATPLPPLPAHATIERIDLGAATIEGLTIDTDASP